MSRHAPQGWRLTHQPLPVDASLDQTSSETAPEYLGRVSQSSIASQSWSTAPLSGQTSANDVSEQITMPGSFGYTPPCCGAYHRDSIPQRSAVTAFA
jgi:hypothetical protein